MQPVTKPTNNGSNLNGTPVARMSALSLAFGAMAVWSGTAEASVIATTVNTSFLNAPASISFGGAPQFTLSRMTDPKFNFGPKNFITTLGNNLYAQQSLAGKIISNQPDPVPGNVSLKFVPATTATDLLSVPRDVEFFVPLEVVTASTRNFGYAELGTANNGATLIAYAFESTPGKAIIAGAGLGNAGAGNAGATLVPEPASLAMLALGAASVVAARRRRSAFPA